MSLNRASCAARQSHFAVLTLVVLALSFAATVHAESGAEERRPGLFGGAGWSPSVGLELSVHAQELKASGTSSFGANDRGTNTVSNLVARLQAGVASPAIPWIPGHPRLLLLGGTSIPLRESATISSTQSLGSDSELGTELFVSWKSMWHVALELQFEVPIADQIIYVKPGIEYMGSRLRFEPLFTFRAEPGSPAAAQAPDPRNPPTLPFAGRSRPVVHHFIGPTLEVESRLARVGPIRLNAYVQGRLYWLASDRDAEVRFTGPLLGSSETGTGRLEANFLAGQVGFGIRGSF